MDLQRTGVQSIFRPAFNPNVLTNTYRTDLSFLGTVRGRVGYAFDRVFVYGTGGFAYGDVTQRVGFQTAAPLTYFGSRSRIDTGYAYGGGIEYALPTDSFLNFFRSNAVTIKAEYRATTSAATTCWSAPSAARGRLHLPLPDRGRHRPRRPELQVRLLLRSSELLPALCRRCDGGRGVVGPPRRLPPHESSPPADLRIPSPIKLAARSATTLGAPLLGCFLVRPLLVGAALCRTSAREVPREGLWPTSRWWPAPVDPRASASSGPAPGKRLGRNPP